MSKELFIVILIFSVLILTITITIYLYNYRINKKVKAYINDSNVKGRLRIPSLTYILAIVALSSLVVASIVYIIPREKLYEVEYVLYTHPESMTIFVGEEDKDFSFEKLINSIAFNAKELSDSKKCDVLVNPNDKNKVIVTREEGKITSITIPNIVIVYHNDKIDEAGQESSGSWYGTDYNEFKEYTVTYNVETGKIVLKATMYASSDNTFAWGPIDSSVYTLDVKLCYDEIELKYDEFILSEETTFEFELVEPLSEEENKNTITN